MNKLQVYQDNFDFAMEKTISGSAEAASIYAQQAQAYALMMQVELLNSINDTLRTMGSKIR